MERIEASAQGSQGLAVIFAGAFIHPKAHVDCATIGARSRVWQFASVIRGAIVGEDCNIATGACLDGSQIGDRCILGHNVAMGPGFRIFDDVFVGPGVVLCNDMWPRAWKDGFDVSRFNPVSYSVIIESRASIGANSVVLPGVRIGFGSMIAAGSVVTKDVPAKCLWKGGEIVQHNISERTRMRFANADVDSFQ